MASKQKPEAEIRAAKLEAAMRANLARRKTQARARADQNPAKSEPIKHPDSGNSKR